MVDVLNVRDKILLNIAIANLLKTEIIRDEPNVFIFIQVYENEEHQAVSLEKEVKSVL